MESTPSPGPQELDFLYAHPKEIGIHTTANAPISEVERHFPKVAKEKEKVGDCGRYVYVYCCSNCGEKREVRAGCNSKLCPDCSERLHKKRVAKAYGFLKQYLARWYVWSHYVLTIPAALRNHIRDGDNLTRIRKAAYEIVVEKTQSYGGLGAVHTFSSEDPSSKHVHVHIIIGGRHFHDWEDVKRSWGAFLFKEFGYKGEINVHEERFLLGREKQRVRERKLKHKIRYVLRLPEPSPETYKHFELILGRQLYVYFGEVVAGFRGKKSTDERRGVMCPSCGGEMGLVGCWDTIDMTESWFESVGLDYLLATWPEKWGRAAATYAEIEHRRILAYGGN